MNKKIYLKVCKIFDDIFDLKKKKLKKSTNAKDISNWDSINNLKLIIVLEKEFKIKLEFDEIFTVVKIGDIYNLLSKKGVL